MNTADGQATFELQLDPVADTAFSDMQTPESGGKCSRCLRSLKGHYGLCHGGTSAAGWFAWCDDCTRAKRVAS